MKNSRVFIGWLLGAALVATVWVGPVFAGVENVATEGTAILNERATTPLLSALAPPGGSVGPREGTVWIPIQIFPPDSEPDSTGAHAEPPLEVDSGIALPVLVARHSVQMSHQVWWSARR